MMIFLRVSYRKCLTVENLGKLAKFGKEAFIKNNYITEICN